MRYISLSKVEKVALPKKERIVEEKEQGLRLNDEIGKSGNFINLGAPGILFVKVFDEVGKDSKEIRLDPFWEIEFEDDKVHSMEIRTDTDDTNYFLLVAGDEARK